MNEFSSYSSSRRSTTGAGLTVVIVAGILVSYIYQMGPSPVLAKLRDFYGIVGNDALLNLSLSIIFPVLTVSSLVGGVLERRIGTERLYSVTLLFLATGLLLNYLATYYWLFLLARVLFGVGFGLGIPFIGSAIMKWYSPVKRERMNTLNGLFPFIGTLISFSSLNLLADLLGSWQSAFGAGGCVLVGVLLIWQLFCRPESVEQTPATQPETRKESLYRDLWRRREIRSLTAIFVSDFFGYSYITMILPTLLFELSGSMSQSAANLCAAIVFPAVGMLGCVVGGFITERTGRRRPLLITAQVLKLGGILLVTLGMELGMPSVLMGFAIYGLGNGSWMPVMYDIPMDLDDMTPARVGGAFALISSCGFISGFIAPTLGGWLTDLLSAFRTHADTTAAHLFGLRWSLFAFGFTSLIALFFALRFRETGRRSP